MLAPAAAAQRRRRSVRVLGPRHPQPDLRHRPGGWAELARRFAGLCNGVLADRAVWERIGGDGLAGPVGIVTVSSRGAPFPVDQDSEFVDFHEGGGGYMTPAGSRTR
ncbi:MAG: hypothetical protein U0531_05435 [Dehalococcoidia bacterium]